MFEQKNKLKISMLGSGLIGANWATLFLSKGANVTLYDPQKTALEKTRAVIASAWQDLKKLDYSIGRIPDERLLITENLRQACENTDWIQENSPDQLEVKTKLISEVEKYVKANVPIASSTTALLPSEIQKNMHYPSRFLVGHPFNPPHLIPLLEIVAGMHTDPDLPQKAAQFYESFGHEVIIAKREVVGHIANRLNAALYREVVHMVQADIANIEDIDRAIANGPGLRWAFLGPNLIYHLGGGEGGYSQYLEHLGPSQEIRWNDLGSPKLTKKAKRKLIREFYANYGKKFLRELPRYRNKSLINLLKLKKGIKE